MVFCAGGSAGIHFAWMATGGVRDHEKRDCHDNKKRRKNHGKHGGEKRGRRMFHLQLLE
jgi:hypothetical protein